MFHFVDDLGFYLLFKNIFRNLANNETELHNIVTCFYKIYKLKDYPELIFEALKGKNDATESIRYTFRLGSPLYERFLKEYSREEVRELFRLWYFEYRIGVTEEIKEGLFTYGDFYKDLRIVPAMFIDLSTPNNIYSEPWKRRQSKFIMNFVPKSYPNINIEWP